MLVESFYSTLRVGIMQLPIVPHRNCFALQSSISDPTNHHVITIPPFLPNDVGYPSSLHNIHVLPMLTEDETSQLLSMAKSYASDNNSWAKQESRHVSYNTVDFAVEDSEEISRYLAAIQFQDRIFSALNESYDVDVDDMSFLDLFCASYEAADESEKKTMDRLEFHRDGSLLSFSLLLSPPSDFEGGGTSFDALRDVSFEGGVSVLKEGGTIRPQYAGYATLHSGKLLHGGHIVTKGQRIIIVGFVDVDDRNIKEGVLFNASKEWGRNDVRKFWDRRRLDLLENQQEIGFTSRDDEHPKWQLLNDELLPQKGRSCFGPGFIMPRSILENIKKRADNDKIRDRRLKTEDGLMREILLSRELRGDKILEGEWREVEYDENGIPIGIEILDHE